MAEVNYAFIKDGQVVNIAVFDDPSDELLAHFKSDLDLDDIILAKENAVINGTYDGEKFWQPQPYPSWTKNEEINQWEAPVAYPTVDPENPIFYEWDESSLSWTEIN